MLSTLAFLAVVSTTFAAQVDDSALANKINSETSQVGRINDIPKDSDFLFDFTKGSVGNAQGGFARPADSTNYPALLTGNGAMTVGVMGPCGANSPHIHPRATEIQLVIQGGPIYTEMIQENGARNVKNNVTLGSATVFPQGSIHYQFNLACETAVFVASFDRSNPGTSQIAQNFFALNKEVVDATLGGVSMLDNLKLPDNFILGAQECLDRCKIDRSTFNFTTTFKDYAIFSNSTWTAGTAPPSSASSGVSLSSTSTAGSKNLAFLADADGNVNIPFSQNPLRGAVIGLGVTAAAFFLAVLGMVIMMVCRRRSGIKVAPRFPGASASTGKGYPYVTPYDDAESFSSRRSTDKI